MINEYRNYINEHIENVKKVFTCLVADHMPHAVIAAEVITEHDESKFSSDEFIAYAQKFFGDGCPKMDFDYAWNHHQKGNRHHWQYWIMWNPKGSLALPIPEKYIIEMLCDWTAMSLKFNNKPSDWLRDNINNMLLHDSTREYIMETMPFFDAVWEDLK